MQRTPGGFVLSLISDQHHGHIVDIRAGRAGYHHESENKGNRKYFTVGAGFRMSAFTLDCGYVIATAKSNPLDQTLRFTLGFDMDGLKDLFKRR